MVHEQGNIIIDRDLYQGFQQDTNTLYGLLQANMPILKSILDGEWFQKKGTVIDPEIDASTIRWTGPLSGVFKVRYHVSFFFACDNVTNEKKDDTQFIFSISERYTTLTIQSDPALQSWNNR